MENKSVWSNLWWGPVLYGVALLALATFFFINPVSTTLTFVWVVGLFWLIGGIMKLISLFFERTLWGWRLVGGALGVVVGAWLVFPGSVADAAGNALALSTAIALLVSIGGIISGVTSLITAFSFKSVWDGVFGGLEILLGIIILFNLFVAAFIVPLVLAIFAVVAGIWAIIVGLKARSITKKLTA